jgi:hypothetical protein
MPYRYESPTIARAAIALGGIGLMCVSAMTFLAWERTPIPDALASIGGGAVGALATLLTTFTPSPLPGGRRSADTPVVVSPPAEEGPVTMTQVR